MNQEYEQLIRQQFKVPKKARLGFHLCNAAAVLNYGDKRPIVVGKTLTVNGTPELCDFGLHASPTMRDALNCAQYKERIGLVWVNGKIAVGSNKFCGLKRHTLALLSVEQSRLVYQKWALWCATQALENERQAGREPDQRIWQAIKTSKRFLVGEATLEEMKDAAAYAAYAAADAAYAAYAAADAAADAADAAAYAAKTAAYAAYAAAYAAYAAAYAAYAAADAAYAADAAAYAAADAADAAADAAAYAAASAANSAQNKMLDQLALQAMGIIKGNDNEG